MFLLNYVCLKIGLLQQFYNVIFHESFCAFDRSHIICSTIACILINVNKKTIINYESQNTNLFTTSTLFTTSVMSNIALLSVTIGHFDVSSFKFFSC